MILMNDFRSEPDELRSEMKRAVERVIDSGWYVLGDEVKSFEKSWSETCGIFHSVGVGNGMDAIEISLRALDIGPGDEVITTPMTAFATILAIYRAGATPVLADIDEESGLMSLNSAERCVSKKTKAVVLVHLYGQIRSIDKWVDFCDTNKIYLIEDCAQAHLSKSNDRTAGNFGIAGAYSFYPTKNLGAPGDAGVLVTNNSNIHEIALKLRNYGQSSRYYHPLIGLNSRLDEIQAAILNVRLHWLSQFTNTRQRIASMYQEHINNPKIINLAKPESAQSHVYHLYVVLCNERDELQQHLTSNEIQTLIHYPVPAHLQESCDDIKRDSQGLFYSEKHASCCLSLPCHPQMSELDVKNVIDVVNSF